MNYYKIINKYIDPNSELYPIFITHSVLVTQKALKIAEKLNLSKEQKQFTEEASMLHDIGIVKTNFPEIKCFGKEPYIKHAVLGAEMLRKEGLVIHADAIEKHVGIGITKQDIKKQSLPLEIKDYIPTRIEEKIITYADLFFSKYSYGIWKEKSYEKVRESIVKFGLEKGLILDEWHKQFKV